MPKYFAAPGSPFSDDDAEEIGPELARLAERGLSSPDQIVEYARSRDTPLRRHLHMDRPMEEAAELWYRFRARKMAGSIMVTVRTADGMKPVRAFHSIVMTTSPGEGREQPVSRRFVSIQQIRESEPMAEQVLADALERLEAWRGRFETYREVFARKLPETQEVFRAIDLVVKEERAPGSH